MTPPLEVDRGVAVRWALALLLALALCGAPLWLWGVPLRWYFLKLDDFVYIARSRTISALWRHLATPHNAHVVPLFLLETHLLGRLAGSLEALPVVLGWASYATLVLAMAAAGHLVAWETGRASGGLAAMAAVGLSSVLGPSVVWYAASQALGAGTAILVMLAALQVWRARGGWWLVAAAVLAAAAPLFWSGGFTAGLAGLAYLWADGRRSCRLAAVLPLAVSVTLALLVWAVAGRSLATSTHLSVWSILDPSRLEPAVTHTAQAVCEALVLNNLGLDAPTTGSQALVIVSLVAGLWAWSSHRVDPAGGSARLRSSPLEAAGAVLVVVNFAMIFAVRGTETTFDNLRALGWYDAIPQLGAVLFVAGWCSKRQESPPPRSIAPPRLHELLGLALLTAVMLLLQMPRAHRVIFQYDGAAAPMQPKDGEIRAWPRTRADLAEQVWHQRRALAALDRLDQAGPHGGIGRAELHRAAARASVPGMPEGLPGIDPRALLVIPPRSTDSE
jgi:hypothetical protein